MKKTIIYFLGLIFLFSIGLNVNYIYKSKTIQTQDPIIETNLDIKSQLVIDKDIKKGDNESMTKLINLFISGTGPEGIYQNRKLWISDESQPFLIRLEGDWQQTYSYGGYRNQFNLEGKDNIVLKKDINNFFNLFDKAEDKINKILDISKINRLTLLKYGSNYEINLQTKNGQVKKENISKEEIIQVLEKLL